MQTRKGANGFERTGGRDDANLMAREAGMTVKEIAAKFRVGESGVLAAIRRAE